MRPAGGTYRACTPETAPAPKRIAARALHKESGTSPRGIVSPRRPLDFGCGRIGPSTLQSTYPQGIIPRKDDPPRFGCSPPTAGGTARTPAKCTPPHRLRTATDPATKAKNTGTARTHPNRAQSHHPAAPRMPNPVGRPVMAAADEPLSHGKPRGIPARRNTRRSAAVSGAPLPHF